MQFCIIYNASNFDIESASIFLTILDLEQPLRLKWIEGKNYILKGPKDKFQFRVVNDFNSSIDIDVDSGTLKLTEFGDLENSKKIDSHKVFLMLEIQKLISAYN